MATVFRRLLPLFAGLALRAALPALTLPDPGNTAALPVPRLEPDFYDWWERHRAILATKDAADPTIVLIGDSITHLWGGSPTWAGRPPNGPQAFARTFAGERVLNLGFGFDRVQNVLWRLDHGEVAGLHPRWFVINIGTNNLVRTVHAPANTAAEIDEGIGLILARLRAQAPRAGIILMAIFPRGERPADPLRAKVAEVNVLLARRAAAAHLTFLDIGPLLLQPDGSITRDTMGDFLHPGEAGYTVWGHALRPLILP